jgi:hypothetical protein
VRLVAGAHATYDEAVPALAISADVEADVDAVLRALGVRVVPLDDVLSP